MRDTCAFSAGRPEGLDVVDRRRQPAARAAHHVGEAPAAAEVNSRRASASVSAATTLTPTIA